MDTSEPTDPHALFRALNAWANASPRGVRAAGGGPGGVGFVQLNYRPDPQSPESYVTLRADMVDGQPIIRFDHSPIGTTSAEPRPTTQPTDSTTRTIQVLEQNPDQPNGREPDAACEACGATGTVGRATRTDESGAAIEVHRFCFDCWPEQSARCRARWDEEDRRRVEDSIRGRTTGVAGPGRGSWFEAATWHTTLEMVRMIERTMRAPQPPTRPESLAQVARGMRAASTHFVGEMPFEVEAFIQRYAGDDA